MCALRKPMHPGSLNMFLFFKENRHLWPNASIIKKIRNDMKKKLSMMMQMNLEPGVAEDEDDREEDC